MADPGTAERRGLVCQCGHEGDDHATLPPWECQAPASDCPCRGFWLDASVDLADLAGDEVTGPLEKRVPWRIGVFDAGDEVTGPLEKRVPWRIGVLDKDQFENRADIIANALLIASWYVNDCAKLYGHLNGVIQQREAAYEVVHYLEGEVERLIEANREARGLIEDMTLDQPCGDCVNMLDDAKDTLDRGRHQTSTPHARITPSCAASPNGTCTPCMADDCWRCTDPRDEELDDRGAHPGVGGGAAAATTPGLDEGGVGR